MGEITERVIALIKQQGMKDKDFCTLIDISASTFANWKQRGTDPKAKHISAIANFFGVSEEYLITGNTSDPLYAGVFTNPVSIPVLGRVQAGIPIEAIQDILDYEEIPADMAKQGEYFALKVRGDSMEPKISESDVVIVRKQSDVESGEIGIVLVNGEDATVKRIVKHDEGGISLIPLNAIYPPQYYTENEIETFPVNILGKVVELRAKF